MRQTTKIWKTVLCILLVTAIAGSMLTGCAQAKDDGAEQTKTITDMSGAEIVLPKKVERLYVNWASGITLAMTLGAIEKQVVVPTAFHGDMFAWASVVCPEIANIEGNDDAATNIETVLGYDPDVVFTSTLDSVEMYQKVGIPTVYVNFNDYESFKESLLITGSALGDSELKAAEKYNKFLDDQVAMVQARTAQLSEEEKPSVYYMDSRFSDAYHTVGTGEIQENWITIAGAKLATAGHFEGRNLEITAEKLLEIDPDIIMIGAQNQADVYNQLMNDEVLAELTAVKNGQVYRIPQGIFPWCRTGPEAPLQVIWAGKLLHPELFEDIDMMSEARDFYKEFYGADVSDENLQKILEGRLCPDGE